MLRFFTLAVVALVLAVILHGCARAQCPGGMCRMVPGQGSRPYPPAAGYCACPQCASYYLCPCQIAGTTDCGCQGRNCPHCYPAVKNDALQGPLPRPEGRRRLLTRPIFRRWRR